MFSINIRLTAALILTLMLASIAVAQAPQAAPVAVPKEPEYVMEKGFKTKIIEVKYRDPLNLYRVIATLGSGIRGSVITPNSDFMTLTVRDYPENIATIEEAVRRLDTPRPALPDIELHVHVLIASNTALTGEDVPAELSDVIKQLQGTLKYKSYGLMASAIHRANPQGRPAHNKGVAESKLFNITTTNGNPIFYEYSFNNPSIKESDGKLTVEISGVAFNMRIPLYIGNTTQYENVGFESPVAMRDGERVVVGTTTMGEKGLIVVLSARVLNPR
jgi:type II secretory pathway component GspD/PulD (secretin)